MSCKILHFLVRVQSLVSSSKRPNRAIGQEKKMTGLFTERLDPNTDRNKSLRPFKDQSQREERPKHQPQDHEAVSSRILRHRVLRAFALGLNGCITGEDAGSAAKVTRPMEM